LNNLSAHTDLDLVAMLSKSDYTGFAEIFDRYHHQLLNQAYNKLRNKEEANAVIQNVFIKLWHLRENVAIQSLSEHLYAMVRDEIFSLIHQKQVDFAADNIFADFKNNELLQPT